VFELSKWNDTSSRGLDRVVLMTLLFMVICYGCERNTSMDTPIYGITNIYMHIFFLILIYFLDIFSIQEYLDLEYPSFCYET
jgi:hypothetical protein